MSDADLADKDKTSQINLSEQMQFEDSNHKLYYFLY